MSTALVDDRAVAAAAAMCSNTVEVDGRSVGAYGYVPLSGGVEPVVLEGRLPSTTDEVALGSDTLANVGARIGDRVEIAGPDGDQDLRVVGRVVLPKLGDETDVQAVAEGAILTGRGLEALSGPSTSRRSTTWFGGAGADVAAAKARIADVPGELSAAWTAAVPLEVKRLDQLDALPWTLGGVLAAHRRARRGLRAGDRGPPARPRPRGAQDAGVPAPPGDRDGGHASHRLRG